MENTPTVVRSYFDRWQRIETAKAELSEDSKELFQEAKSNGFDTKAMRAAFRQKVKDDEPTTPKQEEHEALVEMYLAALGGMDDATHARDAREEAPEPDSTPTGAEPEPEPIEEVRTTRTCYLPPIERWGKALERTKPEMPDIPEFLRRDR